MRARVLSLERCSHAPACAAREVRRALPRFSAALDNAELNCTIASGDSDAVINRKDHSRFTSRSCRRNIDQLEIAGEDSGPRIKRAEFVVDRLRRITPANLAFALLDFRRVGRLRVILRRLDRAIA